MFILFWCVCVEGMAVYKQQALQQDIKYLLLNDILCARLYLRKFCGKTQPDIRQTSAAYNVKSKLFSMFCQRVVTFYGIWDWNKCFKVIEFFSFYCA